MTEVKWIKLDTAFAENRKIQTIRSKADGNDFTLIWIFLLCLAGKQNGDGKISLTECIPYSSKDLGKIFGFSPKKIENALEIFEDYEMIFVKNGFIFLKNWEKYQSADKLERMRQNSRKSSAKYREKLKQNALEVTSPVTLGDTTEEEKEEEKEKEIEED